MNKTAKDILHERALTLSQSIEKKEAEKFKLLIFSLGQEWYGLKLDCVKEVLAVGRVTALPGAPSCIRGLMNLRGAIISVTEPKRLLGLGEIQTLGPGLGIVVEVEGMNTALLIDNIFGVVEVPVEAVEPPLLTLERTGEEYLLGEVETESKLVGILNPQAILGRSTSKAVELLNHKNL